MIKLKWIWIVILATGAAIFVSCSNINQPNTTENTIQSSEQNKFSQTTQKSYGTYLAGRVAHLRRDFNNASDYYIETIKKDPHNNELISQLYLLLVSKMRVDEAAKYAQMHIDNGNADNFAYTVIAVSQMHNDQYKQSIETTKKFNNPAYKSFIAPMLNAWNYVGLNQPDMAIKTIEKLKNEASFEGIYHFHAGMINDYFDRKEAAKQHFKQLIEEESLEISLRSLQIISNFYLRNGQKEKALQIANLQSNDATISDMLKIFAQNIKEQKDNAKNKIITSPNLGAAEALFSIAATFRYDQIIDVAHMFISLAIYQNPNYDLAKLLLADILENRKMYQDANEVYDTIEKQSSAYYAAQLKMANNYIKMQDYDNAELLLKTLSLDVDSIKVYMDLGDVLRLKNEHEEAIKYYKEATKSTSDTDTLWVLYYAMGVSYEQLGNLEKAEKFLKLAQKLSNNHPLVLNYLGYSWLQQEKNITQAFEMIINAYNQASNDSNITDSLGWALYNLGYYGMAEKYLEKANLSAPANAVICDHLGDVYWFSGRKNEARFQWQHALDLKDESGEIDRKYIKNKIKNGLKPRTDISFDKDKIEELLKLISH